MNCGNQLMFVRIKTIIFSISLLGSILCFAACDMWYQDWQGYLEYWSGTTQIGRVEVSDVTVTMNDVGMGTIPVDSTPIFTGYIINPKEYLIADTIGDLSSDSSVRVSSNIELSKVSVIANEASLLQVKVAAADSTLEHTDFTINFRPVRQDTGTSVGETMGITLQYNTPPQAPKAVVWDNDTRQFTMIQGKKGWEVTSETKSDKDGWIYWAWPQGITVKENPDCVAFFSINGTRYSALELSKVSSLTSGSTTYDIYGHKVGISTKVELRALDSEGVQGKAVYSGIVPYAVTLDGNGGTIDGADTKEVYFQKGSAIAKTELPEPVRSGQIFVGWMDNSTKKTYDFSKPLTGDKILTAQWSQVIYVNGPDGSDSNYGSAADPVKSMEKALEKIYAANDGTNQYTIVIQANYDTSHASSNNTDSLINITPSKDLNLIIKSVGSVTINADNTKRVFKIAPTSGNLTLTIENLTITGGTAKYGGGLFISGGDIIIQGSTIISKNTAVDEGGGICLEYGNVTIGPDVSIMNNTATNGGGIALRNDDQSAWPCLTNKGTITNNSASREGGGLARYVGEFKNNGTISGNKAKDNDNDIKP